MPCYFHSYAHITVKRKRQLSLVHICFLRKLHLMIFFVMFQQLFDHIADKTSFGRKATIHHIFGQTTKQNNFNDYRTV